MTKLYLISPPQIELPKFIERFKSAISGGKIAMFQLRLKDTGDSEIIVAAEKLLPLCHDNNIKFILNDSPELAVKSGADGVHIGDDDNDLKNARALLGENKIIGRSCYNSLDLATETANQGADYVSFGAFYPTKTKTPKAKAKLETITKWKALSKTPCSAIGGITPQNAEPLIKAGADYICAISYIWEHPVSPEAAVFEFSQALVDSSSH